MPTSLPVPSKGALRALRHLALGASCTVAVSAGLLTEDRRRRINTAREVHNNAKKLRSARQYHQGGSATIETFQDQALKYGDDAFWLPSNVYKTPKDTSPFDGGPIGQFSQDNVAARDRKPPRSSPRKLPMVNLPAIKPITRPGLDKPISSHVSTSGKLLGRTKVTTSVDKFTFHDDKAEQDLLATMAAASGFFKNLEVKLDPVDRSLSEESVNKAISFQNIYRKQGRLDLSDQIFDMILSQGTLSEVQFHRFDPEDILSRLMSFTDSRSRPDPANVEKAAAIFLTKLTDQTVVMKGSMFALGKRICLEAFQLQLDDLGRTLFFQIERRRGNRPPPCVQSLIRASKRRGLHKHVVRYFREFFTRTSPSQQDFFEVCEAVVKSALELRNLDLAVQVLMSASDMAEKEKLTLSGSCLNLVLEYDWRWHHNLSGTQALFSRLETVAKCLRNPQEAYEHIIKYCVEARDEEATKFYYDRVQQMYGQRVDYAQIYAHLALAKAYRKDWNGVVEELSKAHESRISSKNPSNCFPAILREYAKSHSLTEVEEYIGFFSTKFGWKMNKYTMNMMVSLYAQAKEIDSIARWINFAIADGCKIDAYTINAILKSCYQQWQFSFEQVWQLFLLIRDRSSVISASMYNQDTILYLRQLALKARKSPLNMRRLKQYDKHSTDRAGVYRSMATTYAREDFFATLKIYKRALERQVVLDQIHLSLAVRASLKYHEGNVDEATLFVKEARQRRLPINGAISIIFVHRITRLSDEGVPFTRLVQACHNTISAFENAGIKISISIVTHVASCLHKRGFPHQAIDLWNSMCSRLKLPSSALDLESLTSLLNSYISIQDPVGVRWVVQMLSVNQIIPDRHIRMLLRYARKNTTRMIQSQPCSDQVHDFLDSISESLEKLQGLRATAIEEQLEARTKTITIIEKAIEHEKAKAMASVLDVNSREAIKATQNAADSTRRNEAELCVSDKSEDAHDVDMLSVELTST